MKSPRGRKKLPKTFLGAKIVRGLGMNIDKFNRLVDRHALSTFDATRDMWLVVSSRALEDLHYEEVRGFTSKPRAIRYARALSNGNVDHRVLHVTEQVLVVATENDL